MRSSRRVRAIMGRWLGAAAAFAYRRPGAALGLAVLLSLAAAPFARDIRLDADLATLLPRDFESVQGLKRLEERFGGIGYVVVVGRGDDPDGLRRFADALAPRLEALPDIRFVDHRRPEGFFEDRALYYLETAELETVLARIEERARWERRRHNPLYVAFEVEPPPSLEFPELEEKYGSSAESRLGGLGGAYYLDEEAGLIALLAKPSESSADLAYARRLVDAVEGVIAAEDLSTFGDGFAVELTGSYKKKLDQQSQIGRDIAVASIAALALVLLYLFFHFRSLRAVVFVLGPVGAGLLWTYGLVGATYETVNLLTGFLGAILGGLGTEHGLHLLGRYQGIRATGTAGLEAVREAFADTGSSALVAALVASLTFASIAVSQFRAFREFGVIAALGMLVVLGAFVLVLPALLGTIEGRGWPLLPRRPLPAAGALGREILRKRVPLAILGGVAVALLALGAGRARFDYDFASLEDGSLPSFVLDREVNRMLGYSQTPVVLLTGSSGAEKEVTAELERRRTALGEASAVDFVGSLQDLTPPDQVEKRRLLDQMQVHLAGVDPARLEPGDRARFEDLRRAVAALPFGRADLPVEIRRQFEGTDGKGEGFVLVFPSVSLADGRAVQALAEEVRTIRLADGSAVSAVGEAMVLADILDMVTAEAPVVLLAALASVLLAMWITLGSLGTALLCLAPTLSSILALIGLMPLLGERFNYLNILVVPVLIGTTVDAGVHLVSRLGDRRAHFLTVYRETGGAIAGGLLTSAVGFGALLFADHPGLASIGRVANLGFGLNLFVMLVVFPAALAWRAGRRSSPALPGAEQPPSPSDPEFP